jgi:hypothetical protein
MGRNPTVLNPVHCMLSSGLENHAELHRGFDVTTTATTIDPNKPHNAIFNRVATHTHSHTHTRSLEIRSLSSRFRALALGPGLL